MACSFSITFRQPATQLLAAVRTKITGQGGVFNGDESGGDFDVALLGNHIRGNYTMVNQQMNFVITDKPFFVSCDQIKNYIEGNIGLA